MPGGSTLLAVLAHPDDEVLLAGTLLAQRARGDRVVVLWLTRGEMTQAFGSVDPDEVGRRRTALGLESAELLDLEPRFLDLADTAVTSDPGSARKVARVLAEVRPDAVLTWGDAWVRGMRHPDHQATGELARSAVTLARIARLVKPAEPHREPCPVFAIRGAHSSLPPLAVDVSPHHEAIHRVATLYREALGFGDPEWLDARLGAAGARWGVRWAEEFDAWESEGGLVPSVLPAGRSVQPAHPERSRGREKGGE